MSLRKFDIILTSYGTVTSEHSKGNSVLARLDFFRVVLDEGINAELCRCLVVV